MPEYVQDILEEEKPRLVSGLGLPGNRCNEFTIIDLLDLC